MSAASEVGAAPHALDAIDDASTLGQMIPLLSKLRDATMRLHTYCSKREQQPAPSLTAAFLTGDGTLRFGHVAAQPADSSTLSSSEAGDTAMNAIVAIMGSQVFSDVCDMIVEFHNCAHPGGRSREHAAAQPSQKARPLPRRVVADCILTWVTCTQLLAVPRTKALLSTATTSRAFAAFAELNTPDVLDCACCMLRDEIELLNVDLNASETAQLDRYVVTRLFTALRVGLGCHDPAHWTLLDGEESAVQQACDCTAAGDSVTHVVCAVVDSKLLGSIVSLLRGYSATSPWQDVYLGAALLLQHALVAVRADEVSILLASCPAGDASTGSAVSWVTFFASLCRASTGVIAAAACDCASVFLLRASSGYLEGLWKSDAADTTPLGELLSPVVVGFSNAVALAERRAEGAASVRQRLVELSYARLLVAVLQCAPQVWSDAVASTYSARCLVNSASFPLIMATATTVYHEQWVRYKEPCRQQSVLSVSCAFFHCVSAAQLPVVALPPSATVAFPVGTVESSPARSRPRGVWSSLTPDPTHPTRFSAAPAVVLMAAATEHNSAGGEFGSKAEAKRVVPRAHSVVRCAAAPADTVLVTRCHPHSVGSLCTLGSVAIGDSDDRDFFSEQVELVTDGPLVIPRLRRGSIECFLFSQSAGSVLEPCVDSAALVYVGLASVHCAETAIFIPNTDGVPAAATVGPQAAAGSTQTKRRFLQAPAHPGYMAAAVLRSTQTNKRAADVAAAAPQASPPNEEAAPVEQHSEEATAPVDDTSASDVVVVSAATRAAEVAELNALRLALSDRQGLVERLESRLLASDEVQQALTCRLSDMRSELDLYQSDVVAPLREEATRLRRALTQAEKELHYAVAALHTVVEHNECLVRQMESIESMAMHN